MHDTSRPQDVVVADSIPFFQQILEPAVRRTFAAEVATPPRRGRPCTLSAVQLWLELLFTVLLGMKSYQSLWRRLCEGQLFAPLHLTDDAIVKRLRQAGVQPALAILAQVSSVLSARVQAISACSLAPFATQIVALDESSWDAVQRHLTHLRALPAGHADLLPGKLAARFNLRTQLWDYVQLRSDPHANCKRDGCSLLQGLAVGSLLLCDLGYFSFAWFDYLTQRGYWFIARLREQTSYRIAHTYYRHEGILDALVWLGSAHGSQAGHLVRLVRLHDGTALRCYLTNVLDPRQLSLPDVARLYARRWDIELAFLTRKEHLGLQHWWSAQPILIQQQAVLILIVAQVLHALRVLTAQEAQVDPFELSLDRLIQAVPQLLARRLHPVCWLSTHGRALGLIRPSSRVQLTLPDIALDSLCWPPPDLPTTRKARYVEYVPTPGRSSRPKKKAPHPSADVPLLI